MFDFSNVRRTKNASVIPVLIADIPAIRHWMEELQVTGWNITDAHQVELYLGFRPKITELPVWPDKPEFSKTDQISYFVSFYEESDIKAKLDEILRSKETTDWKAQRAIDTAKYWNYQQKRKRDPGPLDLQQDLT